MNKKDLRKRFRQLRNQLSPTQQQQSSAQCLEQFLSHPVLLQQDKIACYLAQDGELDLQPIIEVLWGLGKSIFLPVVDGESLLFRPYHEETILQKNRYEIPEPQLNASVALEKLDLIFMPLVAFDCLGNRLGMGGGFYDKTLGAVEKRPLLVGVAHSCQQAEELVVDRWDISMDFVLTEREIFVF